MLLRTWLVSVALAGIVTPTCGQEQPSPEVLQQMELAGRQVKAARAGFECAFFAAETRDSDLLPGEAERLSVYAFGEATKAYSAIAPYMKTEGSLGDFKKALDPVGTEFWVGLTFAEVGASVAKVLDETAAFGVTAESYDAVRLRRDWAAFEEFGKRNCDLIGR